MLYGIRSLIGYVTGTDIAGRNCAVYPDDTFLVSYPRSGNTWTRFLIANLLFPNSQVDFTNIERLIPDTTVQSSRALKRIPRPRILKTHEYFDPRYPKTIYIVRDPRDVAISYFDYNRRNQFIDDSVSLDAFVERFVSGNLASAGWGTWAENVASWLYTRGGDPSFLLLDYGDMHCDPVAALRRIAKFLNVAADPAVLQRAVERSSAERMRELEKQQFDQWLSTQCHAVRRAKKERTRKDIPFVGKALSGGWQNVIPEETVHRIESAWGEIMITLGYELVTMPQITRSRVPARF
jgi:sulfotransferase family protein